MKRIHHRHHSRRAEASRGFTLLEIVLALGLASLLLAALYTALQMHWSSSSLGQVEMERSQVARALFRRIETDLRSVVFRDAALTSSTDDGSSSSSTGTSSGSTSSSGTSTPSSSSSTGGGSSTSSGSSGSNDSSSTGSSSGSTSSSSTATTTENYSTQKTGLFGDAQTLVVHCSLPSRAANFGSATGGSANATVAGYTGGDMQSVAYFLAGSNSTLAQQLSGSATSSLGQVSGLARLQGDRMAMQAADESGDLSSMSSGVKLLAPEVAAISFEYFDGVSWTTTWDSGTSNSIPNAIRITIDFQPPVATGGWYSRPVSASTDRFQHTVALPLAQPYVSEDSL